MQNADSSSPNSSGQSQSRINRLELDFLIKLMPEKFDGDRYKIRSFIKQIDSIFELASEEQKTPLLLFVKSRITGKAREQIDIHCNLTTWEEISELLLNLYQDKKSFDQLLEELSNVKQGYHETISQYYQRLEDVTSRILACIHATEKDDTLLKGRSVMVNDMTLNRFIYHSIPQISQMLRYREFKTINEAFSAAITEEKALRLTSTNYNKKHYSKPFPSHNNNSYHDKHNSNRHNKPNTHSVHFNKPEPKQCRYCKKLGHTIDQCRRRQYNNSQNNHSNNYSRPANPPRTSTSRPQVNNVNFQSSSLQGTGPPDQEVADFTQQFANLQL